MLNVDNDSAADYVISTSQSDSCAGKMFNSTDDNQLTCPTTDHTSAPICCQYQDFGGT